MIRPLPVEFTRFFYRLIPLGNAGAGIFWDDPVQREVRAERAQD